MEKKYFGVFVDCVVCGSRKMPGVCYPLTEHIRPTVEEMVKKKMARIFDKEMRFISGVPVPYTRSGQEMLHGAAPASSALGGVAGASPRRPIILAT